jgi:hypothetical protein
MLIFSNINSTKMEGNYLQFEIQNESSCDNIYEDVYAFTEESLNISNHIKYIEEQKYTHFEKNKKIDNLVNELNTQLSLEKEFNFYKLEEECVNIDLIEQEYEKIRSRQFPYNSENKDIFNKNLGEINIFHPGMLKLNDDTFRRFNKFNLLHFTCNTEQNMNDLIQDFESDFDKHSDVKSGKKEEKINVFKFTKILKPGEYFNFIFITILLKYCFNETSKLKSNELKKEFLMTTDKDVKDYKKALTIINEKIDSDKELLFLLSNQISKEKDIDRVVIQDLVNRYGKKYNPYNSYLAEFIKIVYENPIKIDERVYFNWKLYLGRLVTIWQFKENSGINQRLEIKYLKIKMLLIKLFKRKEKGQMFSSLNSLQHKKKDILNLNNIFSFVTGVSEYPRFTFLRESFVSILYDFVIDFSIIYFLIILPMIIVLNLDSSVLNFTDQIINAFYFFNIIRNFRTLVLDNMNIVQKDLWLPFRMNIKSILLYFDIISLFPFDILVATGNPDSRPISYLIYRYLVLLRIFRFGRSFQYLESTKYGVVFRLIKLMGQFILLVHWCGLFLLIVFGQEVYQNSDKDKGWRFDESCLTFDPQNKYSFSCQLIAAVYSGGFIVPGKQINNLPFFDNGKFRSTYQYMYLFGVFFIGQIIVATVFSSVSDLIQSMNQAENKFQEIKDNHRITSHYYELEPHIFTDIMMYYNYVWQKHREKIYGMEMFESISKTLLRRLNKSMISSYKYLLKDFIILNKRDNKFITFIINNLQKYISFPYERLVTQGQIIKGLFLLSNGTVYFQDDPRLNKSKKHQNGIKQYKKKSEYKDLINNKGNLRKDLQGEISVTKSQLIEKLDYVKNNMFEKYIHDKILFPLDSIFLKTGRAIQTFYVKNFTDLFLLTIELFDNELCVNYPNEMYELSKQAKAEGILKLGRDQELLNIVLETSSRSTGKFYEEHFNPQNMWIEIKRILPKYKLKAFTLVNKLDILSNFNESLGIFENGFIQVRNIINKLAIQKESARIGEDLKTSFINLIN